MKHRIAKQEDRASHRDYVENHSQRHFSKQNEDQLKKPHSYSKPSYHYCKSSWWHTRTENDRSKVVVHNSWKAVENFEAWRLIIFIIRFRGHRHGLGLLWLRAHLNRYIFLFNYCQFIRAYLPPSSNLTWKRDRLAYSWAQEMIDGMNEVLSFLDKREKLQPPSSEKFGSPLEFALSGGL